MEKEGVTYTPLSIETTVGTQIKYSLCFDYNALCDVESEIGLNLNLALMRIDVCTANQLRAILQSMLRTAHPKITLSACGDLISANMRRVQAAISTELMAAFKEDASLTQMPADDSKHPDDLITVGTRNDGEKASVSVGASASAGA